MTRFVITGTDTGIGKTVFSAALAGATGASYWKPIQSGLEDETDSETVHKLLPARSVGRGTAAKFLPVAKPWGGGPLAKRVVEGQQPRAKAPPSALRAATSPRLRRREDRSCPRLIG